ncbi:MAG: hypothetical protein RR404_02790 [Bacilli bacterium]
MDDFHFPKQKAIHTWFIFLVIWIISVALIIFFFKYEKKSTYFGQVVLDNDYYLKVIVEKDNISNISNNIKINNQKKNCITYKVSNELIDNNYQKYFEVYYKCNLTEVEKQQQYIFNISISQGTTTFYKKIIEIIKKGIQ